MPVTVIPPFPIFFDSDGESLELGSIFIGIAGQNPLISSNQLAAYSDLALAVPIAQPVRTSGGYMVNSGTPIQVYVNAGDYSIVVLDKNGALVFSQLFNVSESVPSTFFKYDITSAEAAAGVVPVNFWFPPGYPERFQLNTIPGTTDMTAAINAAAVSGVLYLQGQSYKTSGLVTLPVVDIIALGNALIMGTGTVRGVVQNIEIPHQILQVPYNLVTAAERSPTTRAGDFFVDPLLGSDANSGVSAALAVATLTRAAALIAGVAATAPSLVIVMRSGRHETSGLTLTGAHSLVSGGTINWVPNTLESPIISAPTKWFFKSSPISATSGIFTAVANPLGYAFVDLYDARTGAQVECASNVRQQTALPRNGVTNVTLGGVGPFTISITLDTPDVTAFTALSATEKSGARLRLTHWFTSSWHMSLSIAGSVLTGEGQTNTVAYYNGWVGHGDTFGCPYFLQNIRGYLNGSNFCGYADNVWLPSNGYNFFTVDNAVTFLIDTGVAQKHTFNGVRFRYQAAGYSTIKNFWSGGPFNRFGMLIGSTGVHGALNCKFEYGNLNGISLSYTGSNIQFNKFNYLGLSGVTLDNSVNGSDNAVVNYNEVRYWGYLTSIAACGLWAGGVNVNINNNDVRNGPWTALRFETRGNIAAPSGNSTGSVLRNVLMEVGYANGATSDLHQNGDSGVLTIFGNSGNNNVIINENVVGRGWAYGALRGIFADQGVSGVQVWNNLCWGHNWYSIDFRQVTALTFNNSYRNNVCLGRVNIASTNATTDFSGNIVADSIGNFIDNVIVIVTPNLFGMRCDGTQEWPAIQNVDSAFGNLLVTPAATVTPFIRSFIKQMAFIDDSPQWELLSFPVPVTAAAYTVQNVDKDLRFNRGGTVTVTLPLPAVCPARELYMSTFTNNAVVSASAVVTPITGGAAGTAILAATAGKWARLVSDGSSWVIMAAN
jgi:hypothetical protein